MADIKEIEKAIEYINNPFGKGVQDHENFITITTEVLEEKLEREKGCEYCRIGKKLLLTKNSDIRIPISRSIPQIVIEGETYDGHSYCTGFRIDYCPMCGRKLGGETE